MDIYANEAVGRSTAARPSSKQNVEIQPRRAVYAKGNNARFASVKANAGRTDGHKTAHLAFYPLKAKQKEAMRHNEVLRIRFYAPEEAMRHKEALRPRKKRPCKSGFTPLKPKLGRYGAHKSNTGKSPRP